MMSALPGVVNENGKLILRGRVKDADGIRDIWRALEYADQQASFNRALVQGMYDGQPPLNPGELVLMGQSEITNVNWGKGKELLDEAKSPYPALIQNTETLCTLPIKHSYGDENLRANWQPIIEEEFTIMVNSWDEFYDYYMQLVHQIVTHGVGIVYWEDEFDWRFNVNGLEYFKFPRDIKPYANATEIVACKVRLLPHVLYRHINPELVSPEDAREAGWIIENVKESLRQAAPTQDTYTDWERWERYWKNNDYLMTYSMTQPTINAVCLWAKELDGTVSVYLVNYDNPDIGFIYKREGRFSSMDKQMVIFTNNVGSNGFLHSIRGQGQEIFDKVLADNRLTNRLVDLCLFNATPMFEASNEDALDTMAIQPYGMYNVKSRDWEIPEREMPDYSGNLFPLVQSINDRLTAGQARFSRSTPTLQGKQPLTKYAEEMRQAQLAGLSEAQINLFVRPLTKVFQNMVERAIRDDYEVVDPGGREVREFIRRCAERGVPEEAIKAIDVKRVKFSPPLGSGSPEQRAMVLESLQQVFGFYDQTGQAMFVRDFTMARGGVALADRYAPRDLTPRVPMDASIATLENGQLRQGMEIMPNKDQNHMVHAQIHLTEVDQLIASTDMANPETVLTNGPQIVNINAHTSIHLQLLNQSMPDSPAVRELNKRLQNAEGTSVNIMRRAEKLQQEMAEAQAEMGGMDPMAQPDPEQEAKFAAAAMDVAETQARMQLQAAEAQQNMAIRQMDADMTMAERQQKMAMNDSETAVKLLMKRLETDAKIEAERQKAKAKASQRKTA
jgi:hypothetical protein